MKTVIMLKFLLCYIHIVYYHVVILMIHDIIVNTQLNMNLLNYSSGNLLAHYHNLSIVFNWYHQYKHLLGGMSRVSNKLNCRPGGGDRE